MQLAPWLAQQPNYLDAIRSGAGLGLNVRQQNANEFDAANRLRLGYAELALRNMAEQRRAAEAANELSLRDRNSQMDLVFRYDDAARRSQEAAALLVERQSEAAERAAESLRDAGLLDSYRNRSLDLQESRLEEQTQTARERQSSLDAWRELRDLEANARQTALDEYRNRRLEQFDQRLNQMGSGRAPQDPELFIAKSRLAAATKSGDPIAIASAESDLRTALATPEQRQQGAAILLQNLAQDQARTLPSGSPQEGTIAGRVTTQEQYDALPSGATYTGKDGRTYRKP